MNGAIEPDTEQPQNVTGEQRKERAAAGCLLAIAVSAGGAVAVAVPETAYYAAGLLTAAGVRRARTWVAGRRERADDEPDEDTVDIVATLHELSPAGATHVRLTQLQDATGLPDTKAVRALLDDAGITVRPGVRAGGKNGPGVHHTDIPRSCTGSADGCWCRSGAHTNANNDGGEGLRVDAIGAAGTVIYDPAETRRRHAKTPARST